MKLVLMGPSGKLRCSWASYALLRDNVQHFIEGGAPSARFEALHSLERALEQESVPIDAARLRGEVLRAWCALWRIDCQNAAISLRTRAVLTGSASEPTQRDTIEAKAAGWELPLQADDATPIPRAAGDFVGGVLKMTEAAVDGDLLEAHVVGSRARFTAGGRSSRA
jgi:hypothetical protein